MHLINNMVSSFFNLNVIWFNEGFSSSSTQMMNGVTCGSFSGILYVNISPSSSIKYHSYSLIKFSVCYRLTNKQTDALEHTHNLSLTSTSNGSLQWEKKKQPWACPLTTRLVIRRTKVSYYSEVSQYTIYSVLTPENVKEPMQGKKGCPVWALYLEQHCLTELANCSCEEVLRRRIATSGSNIPVFHWKHDAYL